MKKTFIFLVMLSLMVMPLLSAVEPTHQYVKQYMDPMYRQNFDDGEVYSYTLIVDTPDGITEVVSAMLTLQVWHNPTITYFVTVNGQTCNTEEFLVHTTYANAGEGTIYFDCSNVITGEGTYDVVLTTDDDTGASTFWADITYSNRPMGTATVHGTEYVPGDRAKLWLQLLDADGDDVENGACQIDIYTPINTVLIENGAMTNMEHDGIYTYDLIAPQSHGVYPAIAKCYYDVTTEEDNPDDFRLIAGNVDTGDYSDTDEIDGEEHKIEQDDGELEFEYDIERMCGIETAELLLSGLTISVNAKWKDSVTNDNVIISVYNHTSSSWIELPNSIDDPNDRDTVSNFIETNNITRDGLVDSSGSETLTLKFSDTIKDAGTNKKIEVDWVAAICNEFENPEWAEVKGSSEMHISSKYKWVSTIDYGQIYDNTWPDEFHHNITLSSQTAQEEEDEKIFVELGAPFQCSNVLHLYVDEVEMNWTPQSPVNPDVAGCSVNWEQALSPGTNYHVRIVSTSNFKQIESSWVTEAGLDHEMIDMACRNYQVTQGYDDFIIPHTTPPEITYSDDAFMAVCDDYLNKYYRSNKTYWEEFRTDSGIFTGEELLGLDEMWGHMEDASANLQRESTNILVGLTTGASYSTAIIANPTGQPIPTWATYWANASTSFINYLSISQLGATMPGAISTAVWNYTNRTLTAFDFSIGVNTTAIAQAVWEYASRTLTAFGFDVVDEELVSDYVWNNSNRELTAFSFTVNVNESAIAGEVWSSDDRTLTEFSFTVEANINESAVAESVWEYTDRSLSEFDFIINVNESSIADAVWESTTRTLTGFDFTVSIDEAEVADAVWNYANRNLTEFDFTVSINETAVAEATWDYTDRELTDFTFLVDINNSALAEDVWNYANRTLSGFDFIMDINETAIADEVWASPNRGLTEFDFIVDVDGEEISDYVWNNSARTLTAFSFTVDANVNETAIADEVWSSSNRELTGFTFTVDANINESAVAESVWEYTDRQLSAFNFIMDVNETAIADEVWASDNRSLTEFSFTVEANVNTSEISEDVWAYSDRELSAFDFIVDADVNTTAISNDVWSHTTRVLTGFNFDVVDEELVSDYTWNNSNRTLSTFDFTVSIDEAGLASTVWDYTNRSLTEFDFTISINNTAVAEATWNYADRELTDFTFLVDVNETAITNDVWDYANRTLSSFDFTMDVNETAISDDVWNSDARYTHGVILS